MRALAILVALMGLDLLSGCASTEVLNRSKGFGGTPIRDMPVEKVPVKGFTLGVRYGTPTGEVGSVTSELLAVDEEKLWMIKDDRPIAIHRELIDKVSLEIYSSSGAGWLGLWSGLGQLSTISHGWYFLFSAPLWAVASVPSIVTAALANDLRVPLDRLDELSQFARFPAGMPPPWGTIRKSGTEAGPKPARPAPPVLRPTTRPATDSRPEPGENTADEPGIQMPR